MAGLTRAICWLWGHRFPDRFTHVCVYCDEHIQFADLRPKDLR